MVEVLEIIAEWVRAQGGKNVAAFLAFVVLPFLAAVVIVATRLIY